MQQNRKNGKGDEYFCKALYMQVGQTYACTHAHTALNCALNCGM